MISPDFFTALNIDEAMVLARFGGSSALYEKFLRRFPADPSWASLEEAAAAGDMATVEIAAHTLKGVASNFGFDILSQLCAQLVSAVRTGNADAVPALFEQAKAEYTAILQKILKL